MLRSKEWTEKWPDLNGMWSRITHNVEHEYSSKNYVILEYKNLNKVYRNKSLRKLQVYKHKAQSLGAIKKKKKEKPSFLSLVSFLNWIKMIN